MRFRTKIWMLPLSAAFVFIVGMAVSFVVGSRISASLRQLQQVDAPVFDGPKLVDRGFEQFRLTLRPWPGMQARRPDQPGASQQLGMFSPKVNA